ncbi:zinc knuckle CX2CX4HX4C containing protein [Tanacetum coccineum]
MLMVRVVSDNEIKDALFFMGDDKAPRPDGFTAAFFKKSWDIVGGEITNAVRDFFSNDKLLKELNHTIISLILRVSIHAKITDYRPISCCNVLFKCISKIIVNRIKGDLGDLVSINHSAFVPGHQISDNILLMQELMRNYHRKRGPPRCAFKVDIHKAYDMVDWGFLRSILVGFGFHPTMVEWIKRRVQIAEDFQYHHLCEQQRIVNLYFPDDLFLFARGHPNFIRVIIDALEEFKNVSGLVPSIPKSTAFFCNVLNALKASILSSMSFSKGTLLVKYLGVPLISSRLLYRDCKVLVEKLESGLGIRRLDDFNVALMATHVWCILINKESLWVQWIHSYKLQGRSFWDVLCLGDINNGRSTSMWFDRWADSCPLRDMLTVRNIVRSGFSLSNTVSDLISNGAWRWPHDWSSRFLNVFNIPVLDINNELDDVIVWRDVQEEKMKTQDRLWQWDVGPSIDLNLLRCPLCEVVPDSNSHLFFECTFASQVWFQVRALTGMSSVPPRLVDVLAFLIPSKGSSVSNVISRIVLAITTYCLWYERNSRLFNKKKSTANQIVQRITSLVWMKLVMFKFKKMTTGVCCLTNGRFQALILIMIGVLGGRLSWIVFAPIVLLLVCAMLAGFHVLILVHV